RGYHDHRDRPGVPTTIGTGNDPAWLGVSRVWARRGGESADPAGPGLLPGDGGDGGSTVLFGPARRGVRPGGADRRGTGGADRGVGDAARGRGGRGGRGAASARGRVAVAARGGPVRRGGSLLPAGPRLGPPPAGQVPGTARRHEPGAPVAATRQACRSLRV